VHAALPSRAVARATVRASAIRARCNSSTIAIGNSATRDIKDDIPAERRPGDSERRNPSSPRRGRPKPRAAPAGTGERARALCARAGGGKRRESEPISESKIIRAVIRVDIRVDIRPESRRPNAQPLDRVIRGGFRAGEQPRERGRPPWRCRARGQGGGTCARALARGQPAECSARAMARSRSPRAPRHVPRPLLPRRRRERDARCGRAGRCALRRPDTRAARPPGRRRDRPDWTARPPQSSSGPELGPGAGIRVVMPGSRSRSTARSESP
jgi:hypothetical protein